MNDNFVVFNKCIEQISEVGESDGICGSGRVLKLTRVGAGRGTMCTRAGHTEVP
jgi:hypothetical protein